MSSGKAWKYGDNINTAIISPPGYMELSQEEAPNYAMCVVDPDLAGQVQPGDIFVAENNLGSGSSRETAPLTLKILGIRVIIAKNYARIFYRNCINLGILAITCQETDKISKGDLLEVEPGEGKIKNLTTGEEYRCDPIPAHIQKLVDCGGLVPFLREKLKKQAV